MINKTGTMKKVTFVAPQKRRVTITKTPAGEIKFHGELIDAGGDAKTVKGNKKGFLTGILYLAPSTEADGIHDLCPMASTECRLACLYGAGMAGVFPSIKRARIAKTLWYLRDAATFVATLRKDIYRLTVKAAKHGMTPAVRLNGTSDIPKLAMQLASEFPTVQFYDYTKLSSPWKRTTANYHLTFSFSGTNLAECLDALQHGINVAVVFSGSLPATWHGYPVINGDESDLRFLDPVGVIVGLSTKGDAKKLTTGGFVQIGGTK